MKLERGFTFLEVLITMAVIAVLISISIAGLLSFKSTTELNEAGKQIANYIDIVRNAAKNEVRDPNVVINNPAAALNVRGFKLVVGPDSQAIIGPSDLQNIYLCNDPVANTRITTWDCSNINSNKILFQSGSAPLPIGFASNSQTNFPNISQCYALYFESLTGDIQIQLSIGGQVQYNDRKCYIPFTNVAKTENRYLVVNALSDSYIVVPTANELRNQ